MASDRQQFGRAYEKWQTMYNDALLSKPVEVGMTAIVSSAFTDEPPDTITGITELENFRSEAHALADVTVEAGGDVELAVDATRGDITQIIKDPDISTVYIIGNGTLSALLLGIDERYDWLDASQDSDHLKQGQIVQRQCGGLLRSLNVPLGLFVASDHRNVKAPVGVDFYPLSLEDPENTKVRSVFSQTPVTYQEVKSLPAQKSEYDAAMLLAKQLPKTSGTLMGEHQARDKFHERFLEVRAIIEGAQSVEESIYIRTIKERFGLDLIAFYKRNYALCQQITAALLEQRQYAQLADYYERLDLRQAGATNQCMVGSTYELDAATQHPLGIRAIGVFYWSKINNLLTEAYALLEQETLNAPYLQNSGPRIFN